MKRFTERLRVIERKREAAKPLRPCLVIRPGQDEGAELAAFRQAHGADPWRVFCVRRAPPIS